MATTRDEEIGSSKADRRSDDRPLRRLVLRAGALSLGSCVLDPELSRYVRDVLRLPAGSPIAVTDGAGQVGTAEIAKVARREVSIDLRELARVDPPKGPRITLIQGIGKADKMDAVVRQATELGVACIQPVFTERTVPRAGARQDRWVGIVEDAVRVSGRAYRPLLEAPCPLREVLDRPRGAVAVCLDPRATRGFKSVLLGLIEAAPRKESDPSIRERAIKGFDEGLEAALEGGARIELLVGPEGGLSPAEIASAMVRGFQGAHFGPYVLRTETAGPAVIAAVQVLAGAFDVPSPRG